MKSIIIRLRVVLLCVILSNCSEDDSVSSNIDESASFSFKQIPGCNSNDNGLLKAAFLDSCFNYLYTRSGILDLDICVYGNCCPDVERFDLSHKIVAGTIFIAVADTAARMCDCICKYDVEVKITGLKQSKYNLICYHLDNESGHYLYNEVITRHNR